MPQAVPEGAIAVGEVHVVESLLGYECNRTGCCCRAWKIPFRPKDLVRLALTLPDDGTVDRLAEDLVIVTGEDERQVDHIRFRPVGDDARCRFLGSSGDCSLHADFGADALPDLCLHFPAFVYLLGERAELHHDALCPEVIRALAEADAPFSVVSLIPPLPAPLEARLARGGRGVPKPTLFGAVADWSPILRLRESLVAPFCDESRPALETLCAVCTALARAEGAGADAADAFDLRWSGLPAAEFVEFLFAATAASAATVLHTFFWRARRFLFDLEYDAGGAWDALETHLGDWQPALLDYVEPSEPALRPLLHRYLALQYHAVPLATKGEVRSALGAVPLSLALALRVTAAVAACQRRPATVTDLRLGIATAEYVYRNRNLPDGSYPWFAPE